MTASNRRAHLELPRCRYKTTRKELAAWRAAALIAVARFFLREMRIAAATVLAEFGTVRIRCGQPARFRLPMDLSAEYDKISAKQSGVDTAAFYSACIALASRGDVSWDIVGSIGAQCLDHPDVDCRVMGRQMLEQGASRRDVTCLINLINSLIRGDGGPRDDTRAASLLLQLCETGGLTEVQRSMVLAMTAERYLSGRGVPQSDARALMYYEAAAELGHTTAIYNAGLLHERWLPPNFAVAAGYYERICEAHGEALTNLGRLHLARLVPDADPARGFTLLEQAAYIHEHPQAIALLELAESAGLRGTRENAGCGAPGCCRAPKASTA